VLEPVLKQFADSQLGPEGDSTVTVGDHGSKLALRLALGTFEGLVRVTLLSG
jgi:hypothetical protein